MLVKEFDYHLPEELIAQQPLEQRDAARLLVSDARGNLSHSSFRDIANLLKPDDILLLNDSRVISCRLYGHRKGSSGHVEVFLAKRIDPTHWHVLVRPLRKFRRGMTIILPDGLEAEFLEFHVENDLHLIRLNRNLSYEDLDRIALVPLPPYIRRDKRKEDEAQKRIDADYYQTVYANKFGSVAAPTAGLHFTQELLQEINSRGVRIVPVTLEVSLGTFKPVESDRVEDHLMHSERYHVTSEAAEAVNNRKGRLVCVGTTSLRVVESQFAQWGALRPGDYSTDIFITPGYTFKACDVLVTNFHLPRSTLLMLVAAFVGLEQMRTIYSVAVKEQYRFYSYGDATWLERKSE